MILIPTGFFTIDPVQTTSISTALSYSQHELFFNTSFLSQSALVAQTLQEHEGFHPVWFTTHDGITLNGLYRSSTNAIATIIFCAGFYPGKKEGIATFIKFVPSDMNILFFDARGHGNSQGTFWSNLLHYGLHEYQDVLAAIEWVHHQSTAPIIIHGLCAGAFHAARALIHLEKEQRIHHYHIKGLVFDSGIASLATSCTIPLLYVRDKAIPNLLMRWYEKDTRESVKKRYAYSILWLMARSFLTPVKWYMERNFTQYDKEIDFSHHIASISCPILFIHAYNDTYATLQDIKPLIAKCNQPTTCFIEQSEHAVHHLKHKETYHQAFTLFLQTVL